MAIANQTKTIVGVFNSVPEAHAAVADLEAEGISRNDISVVAHKSAAGYDAMDDRDKTSDVVADAGIGAAIGGVGGLLLSAAGALTIPVIGPILAAGPIAAALTGAGIGAAAGGLVGALTESGIPEQDAKYYAEGVRRGDVLVTIVTDETHADRVCTVLDRHDAVDVDDRVQNWQSRGWGGWNDTNKPYTSDELQLERGYYRAGKDPSVEGQVGGIGREALPTPYDERHSSTGLTGTTGSTGAGLGGAIGSYAGESSTRSSSRDLDRDGMVIDDQMRDTGTGIKNAAHELKEDVKDWGRTREHDEVSSTTSSTSTSTDPRDKDKDGWVVDDKMREWGRDIKDAVSNAGSKVKEETRELRNEAKGSTDRISDAERRRRARVYDRTLL